MPEYNFFCDYKNGGCSHIFSVFLNISEYDDYDKKCPNCGGYKAVFRDYKDLNILGSVPHTVGSLIDKNTAKFSQAEKDHLGQKTRKNSVRRSQG